MSKNLKLLTYRKVESFDEKASELRNGKVGLDPDGDMRENIWVGYSENHPDDMVLLNHAICFHPFHSWGAILPKDNPDAAVRKYRNELSIPVTCESYKEMISQGIITDKGVSIKHRDFYLAHLMDDMDTNKEEIEKLLALDGKSLEEWKANHPDE